MWYGFLDIQDESKKTKMKKLFAVMIVGATLYACGPSSDSTTDTPIDVSSSPTGDTAITDGGTGAAKGAEAPNDTTQTRSDTTSRTDTTANP
jgi:hypothetical protein